MLVNCIGKTTDAKRKALLITKQSRNALKRNSELPVVTSDVDKSKFSLLHVPINTHAPVAQAVPVVPDLQEPPNQRTNIKLSNLGI